MAAALHTAVGQLRQRQRTVAVDRIGHQAVAIDDLRVVAANDVFIGLVRRMNDAAFQDDHACAARRSCTVVGRVALLEAIVRCEVGLVRGKDKTVWGLLATQRQGAKRPS